MSPPRIERLPAKHLVGQHQRMTLTHDTTAALWRAFMPLHRAIGARASDDLISLQLYPPAYFEPFSPHAEFEKWAAVEVSADAPVPAGLDTLAIPGGLYAVFLHRGGPRTGPQTFQYILETWLPNSGYALDDRPHFEVLGRNYRHNADDSEEEIWIPIRPK